MEHKIFAVIPCYNEAEALALVAANFSPIWEKTDTTVLYINDGSKDKTSDVLALLSRQYSWCKYVELSRNFGKEQALAAGIDLVPDGCDIIVLDADGQHSPEAVEKVIAAAQAPDIDIAFGVRENREYQSLMDKIASKSFYKIMNTLMGQELDPEIGDFYYAKPNAVRALKEFRDKQLFFKGIYSWVGFKIAKVPVNIHDRTAGKTKFSFRNKIKLGLSGAISMSKKPLQWISLIGLFLFVSSLLFSTYLIVKWILYGASTPGFYTVMVVQTSLSGLILMSLGVVALYLSTIFDNTSSKPGYIVKDAEAMRKLLIAQQ